MTATMRWNWQSIAGAASGMPPRLHRKTSQLILIEGHMEKRGVYNTSWARRYFRLDTVAAELEYFESVVAFENNAKPKGTILLADADELRAGTIESRILEIVTPSRTYALRTPPPDHTDGPSFEEWRSYLKQAIAEARPPKVKGRLRRSDAAVRSVLAVVDPVIRTVNGRSMRIVVDESFALATLKLPGVTASPRGRKNMERARSERRNFDKLRNLKREKAKLSEEEGGGTLIALWKRSCRISIST